MRPDVKCSVLMAFNDSTSSRSALNFLVQMSICPYQSRITLVHIFRKPTGSEEMMGKKFMQKAPERIKEAMQKARLKLEDAGYSPENISIQFVDRPYGSIAEGIIDQFKSGDYNMVVIGRKKMSKSEEFVLGDPSIKLVRSLSGTAVLVVKQ
jgi:nucleotide-binding universal stress UspA family protein